MVLMAIGKSIVVGVKEEFGVSASPGSVSVYVAMALVGAFALVGPIAVTGVMDLVDLIAVVGPTCVIAAVGALAVTDVLENGHVNLTEFFGESSDPMARSQGFGTQFELALLNDNELRGLSFSWLTFQRRSLAAFSELPEMTPLALFR